MPFPILTTVSSMRHLRSTLPAPVALVPTMGMLHRGHLSLIRLAASRSRSVIVSVYINPTQLYPADRNSYPSSLEADVEMLQLLNEELGRERAGVGKIEGVFAPADGEMYPNSATGSDLTVDGGGRGTYVNVAPLADGRLEGINQPHHFIGVATVCLKLFNVVRPHEGYFGEKDYQQTVIVKRMVEDLLLDLEVVLSETVREADGLAVSSRNVYLGSRRRKVAVVLWRALCVAHESYKNCEGETGELLATCSRQASDEQDRQNALRKCDRVSFNVIYFELSDLDSLEKIERVDLSKGALLSGAIQMLPLEDISTSEDVGWRDGRDSIRLIDSIILQPSRDTI